MVHNTQTLEFLISNLRKLQAEKIVELNKCIHSYKFWISGEWKEHDKNVLTEEDVKSYSDRSKLEMDNLHYLNNWIQNQINDAELLLKLVK